MSTWLESLAIDGVTIPAWRKLRGLGSPPPRQDVRERAQRHGSVDRTKFYQARILELDDAVISGAPADIWDALDALKGSMALGTDHVISFRRLGQTADEQVTARVAAELVADVSYDQPGLILWSVAFTCADPRIYSATETTASYSPSAATGGVVFPLTFALKFLGSDSTVMTVTNGGNFPTPPVLTISGPGTAFVISNETTGEDITLGDITLVEGDSIVIDVDARELIVNGTSRVDLIDAANTTWWELAKGANRVRLRGTGFSGGVTELSVTYRDARI